MTNQITGEEATTQNYSSQYIVTKTTGKNWMKKRNANVCLKPGPSKRLRN